MKRRAFQIVVFLLLGAIVNVAVAWGVVWRAPRNPVAPPWWSIDSQLVRSWMSGSAVCNVSKVSDASGLTVFYIDHAEARYGVFNSEAADIPNWGNMRAQADFTDFPIELTTGIDDRWTGRKSRSRVVVGAGWPLRAMWCELNHATMIRIETIPQEMIRRSAYTPVGKWNLGSPIEYKFVPLMPIWPGFGINTIFYAAALWVVFFVPGMVRRRIRRRRGLCPACAYPTWGGGTSPVCTECGNPLKIRTCMGLPPPATPAADTERTT